MGVIILNIMIAAAATITITFSAIVTTKGKLASQQKILLGWFGVVFVFLMALFILNNFNPADFYSFLNLSEVLSLLPGVLLYIYSCQLTNPQKKISAFFPLWIPFIGLLVALLFFQFDWGQFPVVHMLIAVLALTSNSIYCVLVLLSIYRFRRLTSQLFSNSFNKSLRWLEGTCISLLVLVLITLISQSLNASSMLVIPQFGNYYANFALCIIILTSGYFAIQQQVLLTTPEYLLAKEIELNEVIHDQEAQPNLVTEIPSHIDDDHDPNKTEYTALLKIIHQKTLYLNPELSLMELSKQFGKSPHHVSSLINSQGVSFFDLINKLRVDAFIELIHQNKHKDITLLGLAFDSGFNSKAAFNRAFKKYMKTTPLNYIKSHQQK